MFICIIIPISVDCFENEEEIQNTALGWSGDDIINDGRFVKFIFWPLLFCRLLCTGKEMTILNNLWMSFPSVSHDLVFVMNELIVNTLPYVTCLFSPAKSSHGYGISVYESNISIGQKVSQAASFSWQPSFQGFYSSYHLLLIATRISSYFSQFVWNLCLMYLKWLIS